MTRPRSPNPTITVAARIPKSLDILVEAMAQDQGVKKSVLLSGWIVKGYNAEKAKADVSVNGKDSLP
jgi:hypothetical protein